MSIRITSRNARFQQWEALLHNRTKRHRQGEFLVQGVRPITLAIEHGWTIRTIISDGRARMSTWAGEVWETTTADQVVMAPDLVAELGERDEPSELLAVVAMPPDSLSRLDPSGLTVVFDRPTQPGNLGTLARSADAFGAAALVVTGHAADSMGVESAARVSATVVKPADDSTGSASYQSGNRVQGVVKTAPMPTLIERR